MRNSTLLTVLLLLLLCGAIDAQAMDTNSRAAKHVLHSPDGNLSVTFEINDGSPTYSVSLGDKLLIRPSALGFRFKHQEPLSNNLEVTHIRQEHHRDSWDTVWGERKTVVDNYEQIHIDLQETTTQHRRFSLIFRAYNDGIAFRYAIPQQPELNRLTVTEELTRFSFNRNFQAWWIPAYKNQRYEYQYANSALSSVDIAHTPITLEDDGIVMAVHEAALLDYPSMTLKSINDNQIIFTADLVPWANGDKAYINTPFTSPWRVIQAGTSAVDLLNSDIMLNLNAPAEEEIDISYIKPGKYMGIWWEMHIGEKDWSPGEKQGATTARAKQYIDFAAKHHIDAVLIEGWNTGWEGEWWQRKPTFNFTTPVAGLDLATVADYAKQHNVSIVGHHETAAGVSYYEKQMTAGFDYYQQLGISSVKMGYVGTRLDGQEWHHGQFMVRHFNRVVREAARHGIMVNAHETIKATGLRRTFPNIMTRESVRGMEYNGGSPDTGNLPNHTMIIPFTRGLAGPIDLTPGIFNFNYQKYRPHNRVPTTLAKQLALYVLLYSPLQMAADLPENYEDHPAFKWIEDVPTDWQKSVAIDGEIGEFLVTARQDRHSEDWFLGAATNEKSRTLNVATDFLKAGQKYRVIRYEDGDDAHWERNPASYRITTTEIVGGENLLLKLQPGGGAALHFAALSAESK